ncbi:VOC family protein [Achromobacter aloeverae]|uniref:Glyoxalase n=1 Tax=Achromobacter aloeverae TaxID=1750518 RepID=A0A4Q1HNS2_9BURK|nr:VOC family protein [Achromobacter aloeverae]RXN91485.1 glyoxalase [Achromobacter aloeverae]
MTSTVQPIPPDMHTVTPHLVCSDAAGAIAFYKKAFDATELARLPGPDGKLMHAMVRIGDSNIMLADEMPTCGSFSPVTLKGTPITLHLYVADVDAGYARAIEAGGKAIMPPADMFWGDRYGVLEDPYGHRWSMATHKRDMTPDQMDKEMKEMMANWKPPGQ